MSKKEIHYQGLAELSVIVEDTSALSPDYFKVTHLPTELTAGLNTFKFKGQPSLFPENTDVYIEILDANGEPIYYEVNIDLNNKLRNMLFDLSAMSKNKDQKSNPTTFKLIQGQIGGENSDLGVMGVSNIPESVSYSKLVTPCGFT
jgi:hypothetical protein